jgi:hypothetical protein
MSDIKSYKSMYKSDIKFTATGEVVGKNKMYTFVTSDGRLCIESVGLYFTEKLGDYEAPNVVKTTSKYTITKNKITMRQSTVNMLLMKYHQCMGLFNLEKEI